MTKTKVLLADDHIIVAEGLWSLLEDEFELVGVVNDGRALLEAARNLMPDVIVVDISMPLLNGLDATRQLKREGNTAKIVFLTMQIRGFSSTARIFAISRSLPCGARLAWWRRRRFFLTTPFTKISATEIFTRRRTRLSEQRSFLIAPILLRRCPMVFKRESEIVG